MSPPCGKLPHRRTARRRGDFHPLNVRICHRCLLVQLPAYLPADAIFTDDYAYFSSFSDSWVQRAKRFVDSAVSRRGLGPSSFIVEVASNDSTSSSTRWPSASAPLGIEPTANTAARAVERGVPTEVTFLGAETGASCRRPRPGRPRRGRTTSLPTCPTSSTSPRGCVSSSPTTASSASRSTPAAADRGQRVRHDLPRALLLPVLLTTQRVLAAAGLAVVDVGGPTHGGSLRTWSIPSEFVGEPTPPSPPCWRTRPPTGCTRSRGTRSSPGRSLYCAQRPRRVPGGMRPAW